MSYYSHDDDCEMDTCPGCGLLITRCECEDCDCCDEDGPQWLASHLDGVSRGHERSLTLTPAGWRLIGPAPLTVPTNTPTADDGWLTVPVGRTARRLHTFPTTSPTMELTR